MNINSSEERALTEKEGAEFGEKLLRFRDGLAADQRRVLNKLIGGAIAADSFIKCPHQDDKEAKSFSDALTTFADELPQRQREGLAALLSVGALTWDLATDPTPEDNIRPIYFIWVHLARTAAVIIAGAILVLREASKDDPEIDVPDVDLPDIPH